MLPAPASIAALYAYINPIVAILIGSVLVNEVLTLNIIIGTIITLLGVYIVNQSLKKEKISDQLQVLLYKILKRIGHRLKF